MACFKRPYSLGELGFRSTPATGGHEQTSVGGAAISGEERAVVPLGEVGGGAAPVLGTRQVTRKLARGEHDAEYLAHGYIVVHLATRGGGHGLVEARHAFGYPAQRHSRHAAKGQGQYLERDVPELPRYFQRVKSGVGQVIRSVKHGGAQQHAPTMLGTRPNLG